MTETTRAGVGDTLPGVRLGLPASGPGSVAPMGRRVAGVVLDIVLSWLVAVAFTRHRVNGVPSPGYWSTLVFFVESVVLLSFGGATAGMRLMGLRVLPLRGGPVRPWWAAVRTMLLLLFLPAVIWDRDYRGIHDRAAGVVVVRV